MKDSKATNKNKLSDPYVKAFRWASDRIGEEGVVAFVTSNSFLDGIAFDGMRCHLEQDFTKIYLHPILGGMPGQQNERSPAKRAVTSFGMTRSASGLESVSSSRTARADI